jgi:hypothetical protein
MESYIDRDRMIAVSIGASDIRSSILKQKGNLFVTHVVTIFDGKGDLFVTHFVYRLLFSKEKLNLFVTYFVYMLLFLKEKVNFVQRILVISFLIPF